MEADGLTPVVCEVLIPAGAIVDVFGFQANIGVNPSPYRQTRERTALYANTYFAEDELAFTFNGIDSNSGSLAILSCKQGDA